MSPASFQNEVNQLTSAQSSPTVPAPLRRRSNARSSLISLETKRTVITAPLPEALSSSSVFDDEKGFNTCGEYEEGYTGYVGSGEECFGGDYFFASCGIWASAPNSGCLRFEGWECLTAHGWGG